MGVSVSGDDDGLRRLVQSLGRVAEGVRSPQLQAALGEAAITHAKLGFQRSQDPYGVPWRPLRKERIRNSKAGAESKRDARGKFLKGGARTQNSLPLLDTGRLRNSITNRSALDVRPDAFSLSTNVRYAAVHQYGAVIRPVRAKALHWVDVDGHRFAQKVVIPARPYMPEPDRGGIPETLMRTFGDVLEAALLKGMI